MSISYDDWKADEPEYQGDECNYCGEPCAGDYCSKQCKKAYEQEN